MIYFIVNPAAGSGKSVKAVPYIEEVMTQAGQDYKFIYTNKPKDAETIKSAIDFGIAKAVICVGGDGTIQEVMPLMLNTGIPMGLIPSGSGNDFAGSLEGFRITEGSFEQKIKGYTKKLLTAKAVDTDAVSLKGKPVGRDDFEQFFFVNISSIGIDAEVAASVPKLKKTFGGAAYLVALIKTIFTYRSSSVRVTADGKRLDDKFLLTAVCNGRFYGGGFMIAPMADLGDGELTVCLVRHMPRLKVLVLFPSAMKGKHTRFKEVLQYNCKKIVMEFEGVRNTNLDGNMFTFKSPIEYEVMRGALRMLI